MDAEPVEPPPTENLLGSRIVAGIIDFAILTVALVLFAVLFGESDASDSGDGAQVALNLSGTPFLAFVVFALGYYALLESISGQTPGKKLTGIRVVALNGTLTWQKTLVRTLLRVVDGLPFFVPYLLAIVLAGVTPKHQRLGDMLAGTIVVRAVKVQTTTNELEAPKRRYVRR